MPRPLEAASVLVLVRESSRTLRRRLLMLAHGLTVTRSERAARELEQVAAALASTSTIVVLGPCTAPEVRARCIDAGGDHFFETWSDFDRAFDVLIARAEPARGEGAR
jgi:hypothetical protein